MNFHKTNPRAKDFLQTVIYKSNMLHVFQPPSGVATN